MKFHGLLDKIDQVAGFDEVDAHCDVPCKIYDPATAQIAALTVLRMIDIMAEKEGGTSDKGSSDYINTMSRAVANKESHAEDVKREVRVIWGDYFKAPQFEAFPEIHELTHSIMLIGSACKQTVNRDKAVELVEAVNRFAEIFWATKDVKTKRATCPYPPSVEVVYPDL